MKRFEPVELPDHLWVEEMHTMHSALGEWTALTKLTHWDTGEEAYTFLHPGEDTRLREEQLAHFLRFSSDTDTITVHQLRYILMIKRL